MTLQPGELFPLDSALRGIRERFSDAVIDADRTSLRERTVVVPAERLAEVAGAIVAEWGGMLLTLFALDERESAGRYRLHVMFSMAPEDAILTLVSAVPELAPAYRSITTTVPAAHWLEREMADLMGVTPMHHPDPRPLIAHEGWPRDWHPLRKDFTAGDTISWAPRWKFLPVEGDGVFEIPVGPIHAGIIEPGHFRFSTVGEAVLKLDARLGWKWRGLEKIAEGATLSRGLELAEDLFNRAFGDRLNPLYHLGAITFFLFWVVGATGLVLYAFFDTSVEGAHRSMTALAQALWGAGGGCRATRDRDGAPAPTGWRRRRCPRRSPRSPLRSGHAPAWRAPDDHRPRQGSCRCDPAVPGRLTRVGSC